MKTMRKIILAHLLAYGALAAVGLVANYLQVRKMMSAHFPHLEPKRLVRAYNILLRQARNDELGDIESITDGEWDALLIKTYYQLPL